jgi:hypothetical protein
MQMKVGVTGHQRLNDARDWPWVRRRTEAVLSRVDEPICGVSSLAVGADQLFAEVVLQHGGTIEVIVPFADYNSKFKSRDDRQAYEQLLRRAVRVEVLQKKGSDEEAYFEAGKRVVDLADMVIAIWDGKPAVGLGGTGDIVKYARTCVKRLIHINPDTREVSTE